MIEKYFQPYSSVLDVGCGTGRTTIPFFEMGYSVKGIDITPEMIENAKIIAKNKHLKIDYEIGDATDLRFSDDSFDNAFFSNQGWTQIPGEKKRRKVFSEVFRMLKPGGYFIFTTHVRIWRGYTLSWISQGFKLYFLKPFGFAIAEMEFGDKFFQRENNGTTYPQRQFIHIPNVERVKNSVQKAGFELAIAKRENDIVSRNLHDKDNVQNTLPMFYVCRKPL